MFPQTKISSRGNSIFLIFDSRYYVASNAATTDSDNVYFGGLTFPLVKSGTLAEEESSYLKRNSKTILEEASKIEAQIENAGTADLATKLNANSELNFFLKNIAMADNPQIKVSKYNPRKISELPTGKMSLENLAISAEILNENFLGINARLYPLVEVEQPSIVFLGGRNYTIGRSKFTLEEVEQKYQTGLVQELKLKAIARSSKCREMHQELENLTGENNLLINQLNIKTNPFGYECGREGFDTSIGRVYVLIDPHSNHTTGRTYYEGQSAATITLSKGELGTEAKFAERANANSPFVVSSQGHCFGDLKLQGTTLEDKMFYLREVANTIATQGGFYQQTSTSSSSDEYSS